MNDKPETKIGYVSPLKRICMTIGELPSSYLETMSYYEMLVWFVEFLKNQVIPVVNNNSGATEELQNLFIELQNYVNNYFDNLDVQEEINNKLDKMLEDGVLTEIIQQFLQSSALWCFDNVNEMKQATNLIAGSFAKTLGYYEVNDGGQGVYVIVDDESLVDDGGSIHALTNGLRAKLIVKDHTVNVKQFGAKGDGTTDDRLQIQNAINYFIEDDQSTKNQNYATVFEHNFPNVNGNIIFDKATYIIGSTIFVPCYIGIDFNGAEIKAKSDGVFTNNYMFGINTPDCDGWVYQYVSTFYQIKNGIINGNRVSNIRGFYVVDSHKFTNLNFKWLSNGITYPENYWIDNINISLCTFDYFYGDSYAIEKLGTGDSGLLEQVSFGTYKNLEDSSTFNGIKWKNGWGLKINTMMNGNIYFSNVRNVSIDCMHNEHGNIVAIDTGLSITNSNIYIRDINNNHNIITLDTRQNNNWAVKPVILENVLFRYQYDTNEFNYTTYELNTENYQNSLNLNNVYRLITSGNYSSLSGINIKTENKVINNIYDNCNLYNEEILPQKSYMPKTIVQIVSGADVDNNTSWLKENGTYYYRLINYLDITRQIGARSSEFTFTANNHGCSISMKERTGYGVITRIYRGTTSGSYTEYVDIPNVNSRRIYDNGLSCDGYQWIALDNATSIPDVGDCIDYEKTLDLVNKTDNVTIRKTNVASVGTWSVGDTIINSDPATRNYYGWVCVAAGTPGTWKTINLPS